MLSIHEANFYNDNCVLGYSECVCVCVCVCVYVFARIII